MEREIIEEITSADKLKLRGLLMLAETLNDTIAEIYAVVESMIGYGDVGQAHDAVYTGKNVDVDELLARMGIRTVDPA